MKRPSKFLGREDGWRTAEKVDSNARKMVLIGYVEWLDEMFVVNTDSTILHEIDFEFRFLACLLRLSS